ncbi:DUF3667 domain-containing protein [Hymenobacter puniceus]|uniref:DUF3667 domain-containing protein n=1 Tax=Hymenobacter sp. BT190 TaxID=2763505 RepID=UPI0016512EA2|nr:DUF3667 domain-containing protein [Hymenobacter sp. BT190]MBC6697932.1 DUF3667 domain-containing protein [Hymenobacter sp. BT190]
MLHVFTHTDTSIIGYAPQIVLQPGRVVADYLAGRRKRYFNPFQFLLLVVGLAAAAALLLHYYEDTGAEIQQRYASRIPAAYVARMGEYFHYVGKYYNLWWLLLMLPTYALITWLVYRRQGLNYAESFFVHVVVGSVFHLLVACVMLVLWALHIRAVASSNIASSMQVGTITLYLILIGRQAFQLTWAGAIWRALLVVAIGAAASVGYNYVAFQWYVFR